MMSKQSNRPRLGRGLSSLLSVHDAEVAEESRQDGAPGESKVGSTPSGATPLPATPWRTVALSQISPNPHQPRRSWNDASLSDLASSLKTNGLIQPIVVRAVGDAYQLIAGERRLRAAKLAGLTEIPAIVREVDSYTQAQLALVENIHREDLNPIERAEAYQQILSQLGLTQAELAARLGEQRSSVANFLRLLDLSEPVRALIRDAKLSLGHAKVLAGVPDTAEQERLANLCVSQDLSIRNLERLIELPPAPTSAPASTDTRTAHQRELEATLSRQLGLRVQVRGQGKRGRVTIHYNDLDQFDELVKKLGVELDAM
jgi:ParB family chromosome partitioning protein